MTNSHQIARTSREPRASGALPKYRTDIGKLLAGKTTRTASGCLEWTGYKNQFGYGRSYITLADGTHKLLAVHRLAYELHHGEPPPAKGDKVVMHSCDNRACCEPSHLRLGTYAENNADCRAKGRHRTGWVTQDNLPAFRTAAKIE